jgi:hypothetical protein
MINLKPSDADREAAEKALAQLETQPGYDARRALVLAMASLLEANRKAATPRGDCVKLKDGTMVRVQKDGASMSIFLNGQKVYSIA